MRTAIIGGGAAGLMAAATLAAADPSAEVILFERNDGLGKKVIISGGGRCNVTTGITDVRTVLMQYPRGGKFLSSAMHQFPPAAVYDWFVSHGVPLKTEADLRVFPQSDNGHDVVRAFERVFEARGVHVHVRSAVTAVRRCDAGFAVEVKGTTPPIIVDSLILTTGGQAYRHTGSTGDGYAFAMSLGHTLTSLAPSLNALFTNEAWPAELAGLSVAKATIRARGDQSAAFTGPFLFTHKGISGPAVFALSSLVAFATYDATHPLALTIDLFPDQSAEELRAVIAHHITEHPTKTFENIVAHLVPKSLAAICMRETGTVGTTRAAEMNAKQILRCVQWLTAIPLHAIQRGAGDEFVTAGGIPLAEVNPSTMESRICPGLFFAGEILDVDGFTGGFNLQASWATGHLAGERIAERVAP